MLIIFSLIRTFFDFVRNIEPLHSTKSKHTFEIADVFFEYPVKLYVPNGTLRHDLTISFAQEKYCEGANLSWMCPFLFCLTLHKIKLTAMAITLRSLLVVNYWHEL